MSFITSKNTQQFRLCIFGESSPVGYGIYYNCYIYPVNEDEGKLKPDSIRLLLLNKEYIDLMNKSKFLMSTSLHGTFKFKGIHNSEKQPVINGYITKDQKIWELVKMEIK
ncbi:MAG: hypothetical protein IT237_12890 [Bacteroidia bacterium]|nr:hypothetical protein [Bacteroidia bacterium]